MSYSPIVKTYWVNKAGKGRKPFQRHFTRAQWEEHKRKAREHYHNRKKQCKS